MKKGETVFYCPLRVFFLMKAIYVNISSPHNAHLICEKEYEKCRNSTHPFIYFPCWQKS